MLTSMMDKNYGDLDDGDNVNYKENFRGGKNDDESDNYWSKNGD